VPVEEFGLPGGSGETFSAEVVRRRHAKVLLHFDADDESFWYSTKQAQRWLLTPLTSAATSAATSAPAAAPAAARAAPPAEADLDDFEIEEFSSLDELRQAR